MKKSYSIYGIVTGPKKGQPVGQFKELLLLENNFLTMELAEAWLIALKKEEENSHILQFTILPVYE